MSDNLLDIDGSFGEGGGQILRTSVSLAAAMWSRRALGGPSADALAAADGLRIRNIRANRPKPGLAAQHLAAVNAAAAVCHARLEGAKPRSTSLTFRPGLISAGEHRFDVGTAGSALLVLQTLLPSLVVAPGDSDVVITGGTHNPFAPCFEYVRDVFAPLASAANAALSVTLTRAGFYPAGGGAIRCQVRGLGQASYLAALRLLTRGSLQRLEGLSAATTSLPEHVADRQAEQVLARLRKEGLQISLEQARWPAASPGSVVFLRAVFARSVAGFFALGKRGKPAERVADEAVDELVEFLGEDGAVDPHAADQLITLLALAPGESELTTTRVTRHLLTNAEAIRQVSGRTVRIEGGLGAPGKVILE